MKHAFLRASNSLKTHDCARGALAIPRHFDSELGKLAQPKEHTSTNQQSQRKMISGGIKSGRKEIVKSFAERQLGDSPVS
jgi:hypothetical protein